jgi:hypothetical protein
MYTTCKKEEKKTMKKKASEDQHAKAMGMKIQG